MIGGPKRGGGAERTSTSSRGTSTEVDTLYRSAEAPAAVAPSITVGKLRSFPHQTDRRSTLGEWRCECGFPTNFPARRTCHACCRPRPPHLNGVDGDLGLVLLNQRRVTQQREEAERRSSLLLAESEGRALLWETLAKTVSLSPTAGKFAAASSSSSSSGGLSRSSPSYGTSIEGYRSHRPKNTQKGGGNWKDGNFTSYQGRQAAKCRQGGGAPLETCLQCKVRTNGARSCKQCDQRVCGACFKDGRCAICRKQRGAGTVGRKGGRSSGSASDAPDRKRCKKESPVESCVLCKQEHRKVSGCPKCDRRVCPDCRDASSCRQCRGVAPKTSKAVVGEKRRHSSDNESGDRRGKKRRPETGVFCKTCKDKLYSPEHKCSKCLEYVHGGTRCRPGGRCASCHTEEFPDAKKACAGCKTPIGAKTAVNCITCDGLHHPGCMRAGRASRVCTKCPAPAPTPSTGPARKKKPTVATPVPRAPAGGVRGDAKAAEIANAPFAGEGFVLPAGWCALCMGEQGRFTLNFKCGRCDRQICDIHRDPSQVDTSFPCCAVCECSADSMVANQNPPVSLSTVKDGVPWSYGQLHRAVQIITKQGGNVRYFHEWEIRDKRSFEQAVGKYNGLCASIVWMKGPDHWVLTTWRGKVLSKMEYYESLSVDHPRLRAVLSSLGAKTMLGQKGCKMAKFTFGLSCGLCAILNLLSLHLFARMSTDPILLPGSYCDDATFEKHVSALFNERNDSDRESDMERKEVRPASEKIRPVEELPDPPPSGFPTGSVGLRRVPISQEAIQKLSPVCKMLRELLALTHLLIPDQESIQQGVSGDQRRKHLYVLADILTILSKHEGTYNSLEDAMIDAVDALAKQRGWKAATTKVNYANCLYGALLRVDQYTNLRWSRKMTESQVWKDAMKTWMRSALGHNPKATEINFAALERIIEKASSRVKAWTLLSWASTGRPGNLFSLQKPDLHMSPMDKGWKTAIQWRRHHKTVDKVGAYTTHTWLTQAWYEIVQTHLSGLQSEWVFPLKEKQAMWAELNLLVKEQNPDWDMRSFRRGSLSHLARNGIPLEELLQFSGHKNIPMLLRYLQYGLHAGHRAEKSAKAAQTFHQ